MTDKRIRIILDKAAAQQGAKELDQSIKGVGKSADQTQFAVNKLAAAIGAAVSVRQIVQYSNAWTDLNSRIRNIVGTGDAAANVMDRLVDISNRSFASLETTSEAYLLNARAMEELGFQTEKQLEFTEALALGLVVSGAKAQRAESVTIALSKAIASGALRGEEFNTVIQQGGVVAEALADGLGVGVLQLREMAQAGQLTSERVIPALTSQLQKLRDQAEAMPATIGDAFTILNNEALRTVGTFATTSGAAEAASKSILALANNLDVVVDVAIVLGGVFAAKVTAPIVASGLAMTASAVTAFRYQLALAQLAGVSATAATAQIALAGAARTAAASLAFLGGPLGVILLAAGALTYYAVKNRESQAETKTLEGRVDELTESFQGLNAEARDFQIAKQMLLINDAKEKLIRATERELEAQRKLNEVSTRNYGQGTQGAISSYAQRVTQASGEVEKFKLEIEALEQALQQLKTTAAGEVLPGGRPVGGASASVLQEIEEAKRLVAAGFQGGEDPFADFFAVDPAKSDATISEMQRTTQAMRAELDLRREVSDIYRQADLEAENNLFEQERAMISARSAEEIANLQAQFAQENAQREFQFQQRMENMLLQEEERALLQMELDEQRVISEQILQERISTVEQEGAEARQQIAQRERDAKIGIWSSMASSGLKLLQSFGSKSFQSQKNFAIADGIINIASGIAKALNNPYPANLGFAASVAAQGAGLISTIRSTKPGSGGGSVSVGGASSGSVNQPPQMPPQQARTVFRFEGLDDIPKNTIISSNVLIAMKEQLEEYYSDGAPSRRA